jgi:DNA-binding transcriptional MerR regulator
LAATEAVIAATERPTSSASRFSRLRTTGMPIREVRRYAELMQAGETTNAARLALLERHRVAVLAGLETTAKSLELIEWKINFYKERLGE